MALTDNSNGVIASFKSIISAINHFVKFGLLTQNKEKIFQMLVQIM
jgi:hypothetical protein